jgi:glycosyltransferase involved in cell wall biosynthesis
VHDLRYLAAPQDEPTTRVRWFRAFYPRLARRAARLVVPTQAIANEVVRFLRADRERVAVVPNGLSRAWRESGPAEDGGGHLIAIAMEEPRKGLRLLLSALRQATTAPPLVLAGRRGPRTDALLREFDDLVAANRVRHVGCVSTPELVGLVRGAAALVHPSRYEGFGMPVVEALSLGVAVLARGGRPVGRRRHAPRRVAGRQPARSRPRLTRPHARQQPPPSTAAQGAVSGSRSGDPHAVGSHPIPNGRCRAQGRTS